MIVKPFEMFDVPRRVAACPECDGDLYVDPFEYNPDTGMMDASGVYVICYRDAEAPIATGDGAFPHKCHQSDWQHVIDRIERWMHQSVRVASPEPAHAGAQTERRA